MTITTACANLKGHRRRSRCCVARATTATTWGTTRGISPAGATAVVAASTRSRCVASSATLPESAGVSEASPAGSTSSLRAPSSASPFAAAVASRSPDQITAGATLSRDAVP